MALPGVCDAGRNAPTSLGDMSHGNHDQKGPDGPLPPASQTAFRSDTQNDQGLALLATSISGSGAPQPRPTTILHIRRVVREVWLDLVKAIASGRSGTEKHNRSCVSLHVNGRAEYGAGSALLSRCTMQTAGMATQWKRVAMAARGAEGKTRPF